LLRFSLTLGNSLIVLRNPPIYILPFANYGHGAAKGFTQLHTDFVNARLLEALYVQGFKCLRPTVNRKGKHMKSQVRALTIALGLFCGATAFAQTPAPAAKASAPAAAAVVAAPAAATPATKAAVTPAAKTAAPAAAVAAGGGDGKVWVNSKSKVYHCEGSKSYGKTKAGEYMTEADAKAKGNHGDHGKVCGK
jgi:hypothetical protein